jgi:hypothetical protein
MILTHTPQIFPHYFTFLTRIQQNEHEHEDEQNKKVRGVPKESELAALYSGYSLPLVVCPGQEREPLFCLENISLEPVALSGR